MPWKKKKTTNPTYKQGDIMVSHPLENFSLNINATDLHESDWLHQAMWHWTVCQLILMNYRNPVKWKIKKRVDCQLFFDANKIL